MDEVQAAEFLQFMIDRKLLPPPEISFFDSNGERKRKELKYRDFRKYADAIKSKR